MASAEAPDVRSDQPRDLIFLQHPGDRDDAAEKAAVPGKSGAGQNIIQGRGEKVLPLFEDEEKPRADEPADGGGEDHRRSEFRIVAAPLELQAHDPGSGQRRQRHEGAEAVDGDRTEVKKNRIHRLTEINRTFDGIQHQLGFSLSIDHLDVSDPIGA